MSSVALANPKLVKASGQIPRQGETRTSGQNSTAPATSLKGVVVYYSATGSTAKVAKAIYRGMKTSMECDIIPMKKADPEAISKYDVIGIGTPLWQSREPANVKMFTYKMSQLDGKLGFLFCTHGAEPSGLFYSLAVNLRKKGLTIMGWHDWYGSQSLVLHMPKPYWTDGHPDNIDLMEAEAWGKAMADHARRITSGSKAIIPEIPSGAGADPLWQFRSSGGGGAGPSQAARGTDSSAGTGGLPPSGGPNRSGGQPTASPIPEFQMANCVYPKCKACADNCPANAIDLSQNPPAVKDTCIHCALCEKMCYYDAISYKSDKTEHVIDTAKCAYPKCTLCADKCPMNAIQLERKPPYFKHNCEGCDMCWSLCPKGAIEITNLAETHGRMGTGIGNPDGPFARNVDLAEAKGKFRRLTPLEKIGAPMYMNKNIPRLVITEE
jgi:ferredoxin/flavodoxin